MHGYTHKENISEYQENVLKINEIWLARISR